MLDGPKIPTSRAKNAREMGHPTCEPICQYAPRATAARLLALCVLAVALATFVACSCTAHPPSISSLSPSSATAGSAGFTLTINGSNFADYSVVNLNGVALATSFVNSTQLTVTIPAANIAQPATLQILVLNPPQNSTSTGPNGTTVTNTSTCGGNDSNVASLTVSPTAQ
jgi:trimeric autotransporter adhesin